MMKGLVTQFLLLSFYFGVGASAESVEAALSGERGTTPLSVAEAWAAAVGRNQADDVSRLLDESYEHIHGTGLVENKTQFLEALRTGSRKYHPIGLEEVRVKAYGGVALVTGKFALKAEARGKMVEGVNRFCLTLIEQPEGWKIVQFQATAIPAKN